MEATKTRKHKWHIMQHAPVEILGLDSEGQPAVFRTGEQVEGIACMDCSEPLKNNLSNQDHECLGEELLELEDEA